MAPRLKHAPKPGEKPIFPPAALWKEFITTNIDNPTQKWGVMSVFQTWCVLDPRGYMFACCDTWSDAERQHHLYHTWASEYAESIGFSLGEYYNIFHHEPYIIPAVYLSHFDERRVTKFSSKDIFGDDPDDGQTEPPWEDMLDDPKEIEE